MPPRELSAAMGSQEQPQYGSRITSKLVSDKNVRLANSQESPFQVRKCVCQRDHLGGNPIGEIQSLWEGDMNISRFGVWAKVYVAATAGALLLSAVASADQPALRFKGGIGVIPVSSVTGCPASNPCVTGTPVAVNRNIVRGVAPPARFG
jgi:hypothetical protein